MNCIYLCVMLLFRGVNAFRAVSSRTDLASIRRSMCILGDGCLLSSINSLFYASMPVGKRP